MASLKPIELKEKCVMTIAGSDSGGGAGIQADLKTFSALGVHGTCVIASVTSQNTKGVYSVFDIPINEIGKQIDAVCTDMKISFAKTGMLSSPEIVKFVAEKIDEYKISLIVDPVMTAESGGELLRKEAVDTLLKSLLPVSFAVTPNIYEAEILAGIQIKNIEDVKIAAQKIAETGVKYVIITGGHLNAEDVAYDSEKKKFTHFKGTFVKGGTHGTGCTYSAALTAYLSKNYTFDQSCKLAKKFVIDAILYSKNVGDGVSPVNPTGASVLKAKRANVIENILAAWEILRNDTEFPYLIPEVGTNIGMTLPDIFKKAAADENYASGIHPAAQIKVICNENALDLADGFGACRSDVAAFPGRIHKMKDKTGTKLTAENASYPSFGAGSNLAKVIKAAQEFDETVCACINLKYTEEIIDLFKQREFSVCVFNRADEPCGYENSKEWGTSESILRNGKIVPDIIYETGGYGKEAIIRVLGTDAMDAANKISAICDEIRKHLDEMKKYRKV